MQVIKLAPWNGLASEPSPRASELFDQQWQQNAQRTDRMFAYLMALIVIGCSAITWAAHVGLRPALLK